MKGTLIVFFKSPRELAEDRRAIFNKFDDRWQEILRQDELANAELAKAAGKATAAAYLKANLATLEKIRDVISTFNDGYAEHARLAKRSERFRRQLSRSC